MITEEQFTPEIKAKIPDYIEKALKGVFDGGRFVDFDYDNAKKAVDYIYDFCGYKKPQVFVAQNPYEAHVMYYELCEKHGFEIQKKMEYIGMYLFCLNVYSDSYFTFYKFIQDEFNIKTTGNAKKLDTFYELQKNSGVFAAIFAEEACIISKYPKVIHRDEENRLHNTNGIAVEWNSRDTSTEMEETKWKCYYIHGRNVPAEYFEKILRGEYTSNDFIHETNEELKGAAYEIMGQEKFIEMMDVKLINTGEIIHANNDTEIVELYKTKQVLKELEDNPLAWVKFICPTTGASYFIDVEPKYTDAKKAALSTSPFYGTEINDIDDYRFDQRT